MGIISWVPPIFSRRRGISRVPPIISRRRGSVRSEAISQISKALAERVLLAENVGSPQGLPELGVFGAPAAGSADSLGKSGEAILRREGGFVQGGKQKEK